MDEVVDDVLIGPQVNATVFNSPTLVPGKVRNAMYFDGNNQYAEFGRLNHPCLLNTEDCTDGMTYSYWMKITNAARGRLLGYGGARPTVGTGAMIFADGTIQFWVKTTSAYLGSRVEPEAFTAGVWWHIVHVWTELDGCIVYLNGVRSGVEVRDQRSPGTYFSVETTFRIGRGHGDINTDNGQITIDEFLFWPEARSEDFAKFLFDLYSHQGV